MKYHWEELEDGSVCLFEKGKAPTKFIPMPGLAAQIIKLGPYIGSSKDTYRADGPLADPYRDFDTREEAINWIEQIIRDGGHTIERT